MPLTAARGLRYGLGGLLAVFATVGVVALLRQLERMAARIPDAALVGQTRRDARRMAWLLPATVLTAIGAQISGFLVGGTGRLSAAISLVQGLMMVASLVLLLTLIGHCASMARLMTKLRRAFVACLEASRDRARGVSSS